jgi:hypothetical protein
MLYSPKKIAKAIQSLVSQNTCSVEQALKTAAQFLSEKKQAFLLPKVVRLVAASAQRAKSKVATVTVSDPEYFEIMASMGGAAAILDKNFPLKHIAIEQRVEQSNDKGATIEYNWKSVRISKDESLHQLQKHITSCHNSLTT